MHVLSVGIRYKTQALGIAKKSALQYKKYIQNFKAVFLKSV